MKVSPSISEAFRTLNPFRPAQATGARDKRGCDELRESLLDKRPEPSNEPSTTAGARALERNLREMLSLVPRLPRTSRSDGQPNHPNVKRIAGTSGTSEAAVPDGVQRIAAPEPKHSRTNSPVEVTWVSSKMSVPFGGGSEVVLASKFKYREQGAQWSRWHHMDPPEKRGLDESQKPLLDESTERSDGALTVAQAREIAVNAREKSRRAELEVPNPFSLSSLARILRNVSDARRS